MCGVCVCVCVLYAGLELHGQQLHQAHEEQLLCRGHRGHAHA